MYNAEDTAFDPRDTYLGIALAKVAGDANYRLFVAAHGSKVIDRQPYPDPFDPTKKTLNTRDRAAYEPGDTAWGGPDVWFEATDEFIVWFLSGIFSQMRIPTNAFMNDHTNYPLDDGQNRWINPEYNDFVQNPQTNWKLFPVWGDDINDSSTRISGSDGPNYTDVTLTCRGNSYAGLDRSTGGLKLMAVFCNLLKLARCCHCDCFGFKALSIAFKPTVVGVHATYQIEVAYDQHGSRATETVAPKVLFVRILDALLGRYKYSATMRSIPYACGLKFDFAGDELAGAYAAIKGTDPTDYKAWLDSTIEHSMDTSYLTRLQSGGLFIPPIAYTDGQNNTQYSNPWMLTPVPRTNGAAVTLAGFHHWWAALGASSVQGSVWARIITCIERSVVSAILPAIIDYDYIRFHVDVDVPTPTVDLDPVLNAISQAITDINTNTGSQCNVVRSNLADDISSQTAAINSHTDSQLSTVQAAINANVDEEVRAVATSVTTQSQVIQDHVTSTAGNINASTGAAAASIHQGMAAKTGEILAAIAAIPEGESTAAKLNEIISRQQADTGVVTAVCLAALRKLLSPKRFNQVINQLSNIEYRTVRSLRPREDVTAGETGPLSPYLDIFDKFGRPRSESK